MLTIVDYGMGNLRSVWMAFKRLGIQASIGNTPADVEQATALVLPGVGAFGDAMENLRQRGLVQPILERATDDVPFMGICLGMQLMFESSEEMGQHSGLGLVAGGVRRFPETLTVPHMGWNQIHQTRPIVLWEDLPDHSYAYFVHSYYVDPDDPGIVAATTDYGIDYASVIARGNLFGIQFHPEKSQQVGERILRNFALAAGLLSIDKEAA